MMIKLHEYCMLKLPRTSLKDPSLPSAYGATILKPIVVIPQPNVSVEDNTIGHHSHVRVAE